MPGQDDLIYRASIDDKTDAFFQNFDQRIDQLTNKVEGGFSNIEGGMNQMGATAGIVGGLVAMLGTRLLDTVANAIRGFVGFAKESAMLRARVDTLGVSLDIVGKNAGYTKDQLDEYEEGVKSMGITTQAARISLTQMMQAQLDVSQASELARASQDAAVIAGVNSSEAFQRIIHGITTLQPEILRYLGITINMSQELDKYAKTTGKAADQITYQEKQQVMLNATLKAAEGIAGTYEASMDSVGKKLSSLPRYIEEIQYTLGEMFQPAMLVGVETYTEKLKEIQTWLEENPELIEELGRVFAVTFEAIIKLGERLVTLIVSLPGHVENIGIGLAKLISSLPDEEIDSRREKLMEYFLQSISLIGGIVAAIGQSITSAATLATSAVKAIQVAVEGDFGKATEMIGAAVKEFTESGQSIKDAFAQGTYDTATFLGLIKEVADATDDAGDEFVDAANSLEALAEAMEEANTIMDAFAGKLQEELAKDILKNTRRAIEDELRLSWRREDMAKRHAQRIKDIMSDANEARSNAASGYAEQRLDIERDFQRRMRDIQRDFEFDADELARLRDAVGLLRLQRQTEKNIEDEKQSRTDNLSDAKRVYEQEKRMIDKRVRDQLNKVEEMYDKELAALELQLSREAQIRELHDQWAEEDRQAKYAKQIQDMYDQFRNMAGMTDAGLQELYGRWDTYYSHLLDLSRVYMEAIKMTILPGMNYEQFLEESGMPTLTLPPQPTVVGQAGLVSSMLGDGARSYHEPEGVQQIPRVTPRRSTEDKHIRVSVEGAAMDPYIQRVVARTLFEIERNRA